MKLSNNTVLITGGATGIGLALAREFLRAGCEVIICGRREARLREAQQHNPPLRVRVCDLARAADREALTRDMSEHFPKLNVLVNNAGVQRDIDFTRGVGDYLGGESEIAINLEAPIVLCGLFVPLLAGKSDAAIINVSSGLGFVPAARMPVYSATKAALHAFSMALRHQLAGIGIRVIEVVPPAVDSDLNPKGRAARGNFRPDVKPDEFAAAVMKGLAADNDEIGYGMSAGMLTASRAELDQRFAQMNARS